MRNTLFNHRFFNPLTFLAFLTHPLNLQDIDLKIIEKQLLHLQELKKYTDLKEKKLNDFLDLNEPKIYNDEYGNNSIGYKTVC